MKTEKTKKAIVIYTIILGKKNYIANYTSRQDGSRMIQHHNNVDEAIPFLKEKEVAEFLSKIYNPYNREYLTETSMVPAEKLKPVKIEKRHEKALV